jgi:hypothetical protein
MRRILLAAILMGVAACADASITPLPLQISVQASKTTVAAGESIDLIVTAQGGNLFGVEVDYGDTSLDQYGTSGARTAQVTFRHAFTTRGTYDVKATVTDAVAGQKQTTIRITVI